MAMDRTREFSPNFLPPSAPQCSTISKVPAEGDHHDQINRQIYLEMPIHSRRRRSQKIVECSEDDRRHEEDEKLFDSPKLFTEILTLSDVNDPDPIWREASRWTELEEDVDESGLRWMKPCVSSLCVHSFFELRSLLMKGIIELDISVTSYSLLLDAMMEKIGNRLRPDQSIKVRDIMEKSCLHLFQIGKNDNKLGDSYEGNIELLNKLPKECEASVLMIAEVSFLDKALCVFMRLESALNLGQLTEVPLSSKFLFVLLGPNGQLGRYYEIARCIATLLSDEVFREAAYKAQSKSHILAGVDEFLDASTILPQGEWNHATRIEYPATPSMKESTRRGSNYERINDEEMEHRDRDAGHAAGMTKTGRFFGGFSDDIDRKKKYYISDFKDGISVQSLGSFFFMYFACLTTITIYGDLLADSTYGGMGVFESLLSGLICGVSYSLFSGQPLAILGSGGTILVFEIILSNSCLNFNWDHLSFRLWAGVWATIFLFILVSIDASVFVRYITRFTEEGFAILIGLIYIIMAFEKLVNIQHLQHDHSEMDISPDVDYEIRNFTMDIYEEDASDQSKSFDVFLFSIILFFGTFVITMILKELKSKPYFPNIVRDFVRDFAVVIAIVSMAVIDYFVGLNTPKLNVPSKFVPTSSNRGWILSPFKGNPWWTYLVAIIPGFILCAVIFIDQHITSVIVNRNDNKLKKGAGYHLDLVIVAILIWTTSFLGLPWFVASTILSINNVNSLRISTQGEKTQFLGVRENRVTHILIFVGIGCSVFLSSILRMIPMPVLYGVCLYMGISCFNGVQFFERILIMFIPPKSIPDKAYMRKIPLLRIHIYTIIQIVCIIILWAINSFRKTSIIFPVMLFVIMLVRKCLEFLFTQQELKILDDPLPEFSRKKILEDEEDDDDGNIEAETEIIPLGGRTAVIINSPINITPVLNRSTLWETNDIGIIPPNSAGIPGRSSLVQSQRQPSSVNPEGLSTEDETHIAMVPLTRADIHPRYMSTHQIQSLRSSVLEPILGVTHHYNFEEESVLGIPSNIQTSKESNSDEPPSYGWVEENTMQQRL